ncbi:FAD-dependent oxidoreductase [Halioxenophilus aromaticivorans]|uniref:FAD-dependent oxidoreductase n=1 Tax=Halioxenophilus aromaticivorans TaxID=1306992 RepID=A0AAV3U2E9_9ALTE
MTNSIKSVLIIGGGFSGMTAAIELSKQNYQVELIEASPTWHPDGAGISIGGATLRAFETLGVLDQFLDHGHGHDALDLFAPNGHHIQTIPNPRFAGEHIPGTGAIMRPVLAKILADKVKAGNTKVRLGITHTGISQNDDCATVQFSDGSEQSYDLVIAADGLYSKTRQWLFPDAAAPSYTGQGVWRAVLPKPEGCNSTKMWVGPNLKAGINPMSKDQVYLFLTVDSKERQRFTPEEEPAVLKQLLLEHFTAPAVHALAEQINADSHVMFRPLEGLLMPQPWFQGRVVLIGDAVHATTPHLAHGACIGIEDAIVLAEELAQRDELAQALTAFQDRRWERCRMVVENSGRIGQIEIEGGDKMEHAMLMRDTLIALQQPI